MIVGYSFKGDNDDELKWIQHDDYDRNIVMLYFKPRLKYINAINLIQKKTELYYKIKEKRSFDHRVLQSHHDLIAAYFRFNNPKSYYMKLRFNDNEQEKRNTYRKIEKLNEWRIFWDKTIEQLLNDNEIIRTILEAVAYQNTDKGYLAENKLIRLLYYKYSEEFKKECNICKYVFEK